MLKFIYFSVVLFFVQNASFAQTIKIDAGLLSSSFDNKKNLPILYDKINSYSFTAGVDYLERKWFYLSSQAGYMRVGGQENNSNFGGDTTHIKDSRGYVHLNTTVRGYKNFDGLTAFIGVGPYLNILTGNGAFEHRIYKSFYEFKSYIGGKGELGISYDFNQIKIGIIGFYLMSLSDAAKSEGLKLTNNNLGISLSVGYKLR
ncbi:hypothetical protein GCM10023091_36710 [Ravibacter arvi]|uniref:Outer membrane protein beta-barrel domain-containing protein n=1 Tax=Ravibacter arvi TaxID=2051041 RepID=A0ABP8M9B5_9BACT